MKLTIDDLDITFKRCMSTGCIKERSVDVELIKSMKLVAMKGLEFIDKKSLDISTESTDWTFVFRDYYESLRGLIEAYLRFDGIEADNHQCKNAYICHEHPELDLDWEFLETIRLKRNYINYRGQLLKYDDWKGLKLKFRLHIEVLRKAVEKMLMTTE